VQVDLGATAKGLASDLAAECAAAVAGCGVLLSLGGDVAVAGSSPRAGWPVVIADVADPGLPDDAGDDVAAVVAVVAGGLATSSTRARRWRRGGAEFHHIIDPRSGGPAAEVWRTVSVAAANCALANAASTAAVVMGETAPAWLKERRMPARLVRSTGEITLVAGWPGELS
jgi:thiamine biosynthesis lipoprotein